MTPMQLIHRSTELIGPTPIQSALLKGKGGFYYAQCWTNFMDRRTRSYVEIWWDDDDNKMEGKIYRKHNNTFELCPDVSTFLMHIGD